MSDNTNDDGRVVVEVSARSVHKAVQNVMKNEMKLDPDQIRNEVIAEAKAKVDAQVDAYLRGNGYDQAKLKERVQSYLDHYLKRDFESVVRDAVKAQVYTAIQEMALTVVSAVVREGVTLNFGWNKSIKLKTAEADTTSPEPKEQKG